MADRSRRSRVQGGWGGPSNAPSRSSDGTTDGAAKLFPQNSCDGTKKFVFENVVLDKEPLQRTLSASGDYVISDKPNGESRLILKTDFINPEDCEWMFQQLRDELHWHQNEVKRKGYSYLLKRLTSWIGEIPYSYSGVVHGPCAEYSPLLAMLRDTVESHTGRVYNSVLANLYRDGHDHAPWHCDDETVFGTHPSIASISFGETRTFELRRKPFGERHRTTRTGDLKDSDYTEYIKIPLKAGTLLLMEGATQLDWQHRVAREYHDKKERINLTFRFVLPG